MWTLALTEGQGDVSCHPTLWGHALGCSRPCGRIPISFHFHLSGLLWLRWAAPALDKTPSHINTINHLHSMCQTMTDDPPLWHHDCGPQSHILAKGNLRSRTLAPCCRVKSGLKTWTLTPPDHHLLHESPDTHGQWDES